MLRGIGAEGLAASRDQVSQLASSGDGDRLGDELFAVADMLGGQGSVRRALTNPSAGAEAKNGLVRALFGGGKVSDATLAVVSTTAEARWSSAGDLVDTLEQLGVLALVISAERAGGLDDLEDDLFRFGRVVAGDRHLRDVITNQQLPVRLRQELVAGLLEGKASPAAARLAVRAVASRERSFETALESYQKMAADRQHRMTAVVRTAVALSDAEHDRLAAALRQMYDREVHLNVVVDPTVLGGIRVELGDDIIDGTVAGRLDEARRRMTT